MSAGLLIHRLYTRMMYLKQKCAVKLNKMINGEMGIVETRFTLLLRR
jgi:hypothetical protein